MSYAPHRSARPHSVRLSLILLILIAPGCATLINGFDQEISLVAEPEGTTVVVNGKERLATPTVLEVPRNEDLHLLFQYPGYQSEYRRLQPSISTALGLDVVFLYGAPIVMAADLIAGGGYELSQDFINVSLEPMDRTQPAPTPTPPIASAPPPTSAPSPPPTSSYGYLSLSDPPEAKRDWIEGEDLLYPAVGAVAGLAIGGVGIYYMEKNREHRCLEHNPASKGHVEFCELYADRSDRVRFAQRAWLAGGTAVGLTAGLALLQSTRADWESSLALPLAGSVLLGAGALWVGLHYWHPRSPNDAELALEATLAPLAGYALGRILNRWIDLEIDAQPIVDESDGSVTGGMVGLKAEF